ncbi:uncharacterized protein LOC144125695 [Amblyomma americanum]
MEHELSGIRQSMVRIAAALERQVHLTEARQGSVLQPSCFTKGCAGQEGKLHLFVKIRLNVQESFPIRRQGSNFCKTEYHRVTMGLQASRYSTFEDFIWEQTAIQLPQLPSRMEYALTVPRLSEETPCSDH